MAERYGDYASIVGGATVILFFILYMLDANTWTSTCGKITQIICLFLFVLGIGLMVLLMTDAYPYGPICFFAFFTPLFLISISKFLNTGVRTRVYVSWLSGPLLLISVIIGIVWLVWTFLRDENEFNEATKVAFAQATGCQPNLQDYPDCASTTTSSNNINANNNKHGVCFTVIESPPGFTFEENCDPSCPSDVYVECLNGFILWAGPLLVGLVLFFLSFFCTFLRSDNSERDMINFGKLWLFLLFTMWLTASLAGVAAGLSSALLALTLASFVGSAIFVATTRSAEEGKEQATGFWERVSGKYEAYLDWGRGLFMVTCLPIICFYVVLSFFNQLVRKLGLPCSKVLKTEETQRDYLTKRTRIQIQTFVSWDRSKVYTYACYWGIAFMIIWVIVAQFTVLFLSWLIEKTSVMSLGAVTGILIGVGMLMFLLPPVPGVPIYLALGIVILAVGRDILGIPGSMAYASAVSLILKLAACTLQQKLIGENLAQYTSVRKLVGINSTIIKAMRLVLAQKGMGLDKVSILVGGPDWPTSVLCGIMELKLIPILVGTLPVFFLILPTMFIGSFTYMAGLRLEDGSLEFPSAGVLATVSAAITALVQFGSMLFAAYFLEQTISKRKEELDAIEIDKEVAELEAKEEHFNQCYHKVTQWEVVPLCARITLSLALAYMVMSCYMVQLFGNQCFAPYQLTYTIDEHLGGNWTNLVLPLGWCAIGLFLLSCLLLYAFITWANYRAKALAEETSMVVPDTGDVLETEYKEGSEIFRKEEEKAASADEVKVNVVELAHNDSQGETGSRPAGEIEMEYVKAPS